MRRRHQGPALITALVLALPILWIYFTAEMRDVESERQLSLALSALRQRDAELVTMLLRSRGHVDNHFDHLSKAQSQMRDTMTTLRQLVVAPALQINEQLQQVDRLVTDKLAQVEQFKSLHAKLSNSLRYLPKLNQLINDKVRRNEMAVAPALLTVVDDIVRSSLSLRVFGDPLRLSELKNLHAQLLLLLRQTGVEEPLLRGFDAHTRLFLTVRLAERDAVDQIVNDRLSAAVTKLEYQLDHLHDNEIAKTLQIKYFLLAYVVVLFLVIGVFIVNRYRLIAQSQQHKSLSELDQLTQLHNRRYFLEQLEKALEAPVADHVGALLFVDLDGFKAVNDVHGHGTGDKVLRDIAGRLQCQAEDSQAVGVRHRVARLGGDEFVILLEGLPKSSADGVLRQTADETLALCAQPLQYLEGIALSASIGIALFNGAGKDPGIDLAELLHSADQAMYQAKRLGKNGYAFYEHR